MERAGAASFAIELFASFLFQDKNEVFASLEKKKYFFQRRDHAILKNAEDLEELVAQALFIRCKERRSFDISEFKVRAEKIIRREFHSRE